MSDLNEQPIEPKSESPGHSDRPAEASGEPSAEAELPSLPRADPPFGEIKEAAADPSPPQPETRLDLLPWPKAPEAAEAPLRPKPRAAARWPLDPLGVAAGLAAAGFVAVSLFAGYDHLHQTALVAARAQENQDIVKTVATLKTRLEAIETARSQEQSVELRKTLAEVKAAVQTAQGVGASVAQLAQRVDKVEKEHGARIAAIEAARGQDQTAELHKTLAEVKTAAQTAQGVGASLAQLAQRVDKVEKDQGARIDKLGEKLEQTASSRNAELIARLEKLEKRPVAVAVAQPAPAPAAPKPTASPGVSNETTGSIEKPKTVLRGYIVDDVRGNVAFLESREGPMTASPGDFLPGAGRVLRIERHGPNWVVVTSQGVIMTPDEPY